MTPDCTAAQTGLFNLAGRRALVTGASRGLGYEIAVGLARAGASVLLNSRDRDRLTTLVIKLRAEGLTVDRAPFDVADRAAASRALSHIRSEHGDLDILVSNVGHRLRSPLAEIDSYALSALFETNVASQYELARDAAGEMAARGWGRLIFVSSVAARFASPATTAYGAGKAALESLARSFAVAYGAFGVTSNALAPGPFSTEVNAERVRTGGIPEWIPARRWGRPEEIAGAAVFLASPAASYVNGHVLTIDGGLTAAVG